MENSANKTFKDWTKPESLTNKDLASALTDNEIQNHIRFGYARGAVLYSDLMCEAARRLSETPEPTDIPTLDVNDIISQIDVLWNSFCENGWGDCQDCKNTKICDAFRHLLDVLKEFRKTKEGTSI